MTPPLIPKTKMNKYNIVLKSFKHFPAFSEETFAFKANLAINGKVVGWADNNGHGASTNAHINVESGIKIDPSELEEIVDTLVYEAVNAKETEKYIKWVKKELSKHIIFTRKGEEFNGKFFTFKNANLDPAMALRVRERIAKEGIADKILNDVSVEEAMAVMVK